MKNKFSNIILMLGLLSTLKCKANSTIDCVLNDNSTIFAYDCTIYCFELESSDSQQEYFIRIQNLKNSKASLSIPKSLQQHIQTLIFDGTYVEFLPENIHELLPNLLEIIASSTSIKIATIENFKKLKNLTNLRLGNGELTDICGTAFHDLQSLKKLDLSINEIKFLHPNLFKENLQLQDINLSSNLLEILHPLLFSLLSKLSILDLSFNAITFIDKRQFIRNKQLRELQLTGNNIKAIEYGAFDGLVNIDDNPCTADYNLEYQGNDNNINSSIKFVHEDCSKIGENQHEIEVKINAYNKWFGSKYVADKCGSDDKRNYSPFYLKSSGTTKLLGSHISVFLVLINAINVKSLMFQ